MPPWLSITTLVLLLALAGWGMWHGWRRRERASEQVVTVLPVVPDDPGAPRLGPLEATYVSSTTAGDWLDRVSAHDLGARSQAQVEVSDAGVLLRRSGAADVFVPAGLLRGVRTSPGMAGKFVGGDGLVVVTWEVAVGRLLDTGLLLRRRDQRPALVAAVRALLPGTAEPTGPSGHPEPGEPVATGEDTP